MHQIVIYLTRFIFMLQSPTPAGAVKLFETIKISAGYFYLLVSSQGKVL